MTIALPLITAVIVAYGRRRASWPPDLPLGCLNCTGRRPLRLGGSLVCRWCGFEYEAPQ